MDTIPDEFKCPITLDLMNNPVLAPDGYTYEESAIMSIRDSLSPMTRQPIDKTKLIPNRALKNAIDRFTASNSQVKEYLLEKNKHDTEAKIKLEQEKKAKEKRELEERKKIEERRQVQLRLEHELRQEQLRLEQERRQAQYRLEQERRQAQIRFEQECQEKIRIKQEKELSLITKYNEKNPSFDYGVINQHGCNSGNNHYSFIRP